MIDIEVSGPADPTPKANGQTDLREWALAASMPAANAEMPEWLIDFAAIFVGRCADIGERYNDHDMNCGKEIRAMFGLG